MSTSRPHPTAVAALLRHISKFIAALSDEDVDDLLSGRAKLILRRDLQQMAKHSKRGTGSRVSLVDTRNRLLTLADREEGLKVLAEGAPTRQLLKELATMIDVPVLKSDTVERLRDRIIEATIGYRLRSSAIRGPGADLPQESKGGDLTS